MTYDAYKLEQLLKKAGQTHLLCGFDRLSEEERVRLANEITSVDFSIFERAKFFDEKNYDRLAPIPIFSI